MIHLSLSLNGGGVCQTFTMTNMKEKKSETFTDKAPDWRYIYKGLNIEGKCKNKDCEAYNQSVWCKWSFGKFNMSKVVC